MIRRAAAFAVLVVMAVSLASAASSASDVRAAEVPSPLRPADIGIGAYRALLVGVQGYPRVSRIGSLTTPVADVQALSEVFQGM